MCSGGAADTWGRTWTAAELNNLRVRITNVASSTARTFSLDWLPVPRYLSHGAANRYAHRDGHARPHQHANAVTYGDAHRDRNVHGCAAHEHANACTHVHTDEHTGQHANSYTHQHGDQHARATSTPALPPGALSRTGWVASASNGNTGALFALDGGRGYTSSWYSGAAQYSGMWFQVDLASPQTFSQVVLDNVSATDSYPRVYQVFVSNDGTDWGSAARRAAARAG